MNRVVTHYPVFLFTPTGALGLIMWLMFKDLFSSQSGDYAKFRPTYPPEIFRYLASLCPSRSTAWDCGTGNGQAAVAVAEWFDRVIATDPSGKQLAQNVRHPQVDYRVAAAEASGLPSNSVDLVTAAQAFHWFDQDRFFDEVRRVCKPQGVLAIWSYGLARVTPEVDAVVLKFYSETLGRYWEIERRLVDDGYRNVSLPFQEVTPPHFEMTVDWSFNQLLGYLGTWSALQTFITKNGFNPLEALGRELHHAWGAAETRVVRWELALRAGRSRASAPGR